MACPSVFVKDSRRWVARRDDKGPRPLSSIDLRNVRTVGGTQARGFEHLCFQLREPAPEGWSTTKTGDPDGGVEWYYEGPSAEVRGFQCKFVWNVNDLIAAAKVSFDAVVRNRSARRVDVLTFFAPFDLPDAAERTAGGRPTKSARARWNDAVRKWRATLPEGEDIAVHLITEGEILERLLQPGNEGRRNFFFDSEFLSRQWFESQLRKTIALADERYTPESNVDLVIGRDIDGVRRAPSFENVLSSANTQASVALSDLARILERDRSHEGFPMFLAELARELDRVRLSGHTPALNVTGVSDDIQLTALVRAVEDALAPIIALDNSFPDEQGARPLSGAETYRPGALRRKLQDVHEALTVLKQFEATTAVRAARTGSLLITGEAGQGKTHLLIDATRRALLGGDLAICLLGEVLDAGRDILTQAAEHLGLGPMSHDRLLGTLTAAAQTTSSRLLICIDALNESAALERWPSQLIALITELQDYPDLSLVVSCRSDLAALAVPVESKCDSMGLIQRRHPGFLGRELEALEAYFRAVPSAWPKVPLLQPDFSSPLFVKLYAAGLDGLPAAQISQYDKHRSAVFDKFIASRVERINRHLQLDPTQRKVEQALRAFESRLSHRATAKLSNSEATELFESFLPDRTKWPETLLQKLLSEGVLGRAMLFEHHEPVASVQFAYQALGDFRIASTAIADHSGDVATARSGTALWSEQSGLRAWFCAAAPNLQRAFVVLYAEATGQEVLDGLYPDAHAIYYECAAAGSWDGHETLRDVLAITVETIPHRRPASVSERTLELARIGQHPRSRPNLWDSVIAVAVEPQHVLNADRLHTILLNAGRLERDAFWIEYTWHILADDSSPLLRLMRWAEQRETPSRLTPGGTTRGGTQGADPEVVRLAATTLAWLLVSSNRFVRDRTTKALTQLLLGHGSTLLALLRRFAVDDVRRVDDAYLIQRLVVVAYGWAMRVGRSDPNTLANLAEFVRSHILGADSLVNRHYPDVLTRDAAQGILELAAHVLPAFKAEPGPPYSSTRPGNPPTEEALNKRYERRRRDSSGSVQRSWTSLFLSIFSLGDFGNYEIEPAVRNISKARRTGARPGRGGAGSEPRMPVKSRWASFLRMLSPELRSRVETLESEDVVGLLGFLSELDSRQRAAYHAAFKRPRRVGPGAIDARWARRWVFNEVVRLGWTPDRFDEIESRLAREHSRTAHKAERIGKKYQWMALHRLLAKLLDNHYFVHQYRRGGDDYVGAWQLRLRDIDPSLPPAHFSPPNYYYDDSDSEWSDPASPGRAEGSTFTGPHSLPWDFKLRVLPDRREAEQWALSDIDLPSLDERLIRNSADGRRWVSLSEYVTHSAPSTSHSWDDGRAEEWSHIYGWLIKAPQAAALATALENRTLMGRWMPEGGDRTSNYLGEFLWRASWENVDADVLAGDEAQFGREWAESVSLETQSGVTASDLFVLPASIGYLWEASVDCSIEESVNVTVPAAALLDTPTITRHPDTPDWFDGPTHIASFVRIDTETTRGGILLVAEDWLRARLLEEGWELVVGLLGERRVLSGASKKWQQFDHIARLEATGWTYGKLRPKCERAYDYVDDDLGQGGDSEPL